jgi:hypothetical protein
VSIVFKNIDPELCLQIEIVLRKTENFDELMAAGAGDATSGDGEERS